jgi:hypothetical protein
MSKWLVVVVLALLVLTSAMSVKALTLSNTGAPVPPSPWLAANTGAPVPPSPWMNTGAPVPPSPWSNTGAPVPPSPWN